MLYDKAEDCPNSNRLIAHLIRRFTKLLFRPLRVSGRRVQVLMAEDLGQRHQIIGIVGQELMSHRVPQQVRMELEPADLNKLLASVSHTPIRQWSAAADEDV